jgi:hypothetical protein
LEEKIVNIKIPHELLFDKLLTYGEKIIFICLLSEFQMQQKFIISISLKEFCCIYGFSKNTFIKGVKNLVKNEYIIQIKEINDKGTFYTAEYQLLKFKKILNIN